ncbi:MAG: carboxypeptidase-like regulatory domain-containing protein [Planctomycetaceae bacterium]|jgi:hypothetical protein|nr:carboxypeptidase-like regulatory domain-containing protein [Planctomycetaceae bacterium]
MKNYLNKIYFVFTVLTVLILEGCFHQTQPDGLPKLYPVTVAVTQDDKPLTDANVMLVSASQWTSGGITNSNGFVTLYTHGKYPGVPIGTYKVTVSKIRTEGDPPPRAPYDAESARIYAEYKKSGKKYTRFQIVPKEYRESETTPLTIEVKNGTNMLSLNIIGTVTEPARLN